MTANIYFKLEFREFPKSPTNKLKSILHLNTIIITVKKLFKLGIRS